VKISIDVADEVVIQPYPYLKEALELP